MHQDMEDHLMQHAGTIRTTVRCIGRMLWFQSTKVTARLFIFTHFLERSRFLSRQATVHVNIFHFFTPWRLFSRLVSIAMTFSVKIWARLSARDKSTVLVVLALFLNGGRVSSLPSSVVITCVVGPMVTCSPSHYVTKVAHECSDNVETRYFLVSPADSPRIALLTKCNNSSMEFGLSLKNRASHCVSFS